MAQNIKINQLSNSLNQEIVSDFLVSQKELREGTKANYLRLTLADKTGSMVGNVWSNADTFSEKFKEGDVVRIKAIVISYKGKYQLNINVIKPLFPEEYNLADFIASTDKDINKLSDKLFLFIDSIKNNYLKEMLLNIFEDKEFYSKFAQAPAAKSWHHNYVGGLLEHTISVATICDFSSHHYPVDRDLLLIGAILHDIGKVREYSLKSSIDFTAEGRLVGHIPLGDQLVCEQAAKINNFPQGLLMKLRHLILAHHGEYEFASARLPQTIEAVLLHQADNLDAQTVGVKQLIEAQQNPEAEWTDFDRLNNRFYFMK
ncbi:MAG: HD domain-containing protein [Candidatus Cloacimonetes bacterium]|nr:HD domain-containing protein [Candidatus Cloacimonadota bacterium]